MHGVSVILRVEEPTEWCSGMVLVPQKMVIGKFVSTSLTLMKQSAERNTSGLQLNRHPLAGSVFSELDANRGFWKIVLSPESAKYTTFITPFGHYYFHRLPFNTGCAWYLTDYRELYVTCMKFLFGEKTKMSTTSDSTLFCTSSSAQQKAFEKLKTDPESPAALTLYDPNKELEISADESS